MKYDDSNAEYLRRVALNKKRYDLLRSKVWDITKKEQANKEMLSSKEYIYANEDKKRKIRAFANSKTLDRWG